MYMYLYYMHMSYLYINAVLLFLYIIAAQAVPPVSGQVSLPSYLTATARRHGVGSTLALAKANLRSSGEGWWSSGQKNTSTTVQQASKGPTKTWQSYWKKPAFFQNCSNFTDLSNLLDKVLPCLFSFQHGAYSKVSFIVGVLIVRKITTTKYSPTAQQHYFASTCSWTQKPWQATNGSESLPELRNFQVFSGTLR